MHWCLLVYALFLSVCLKYPSICKPFLFKKKSFKHTHRKMSITYINSPLWWKRLLTVPGTDSFIFGPNWRNKETFPPKFPQEPSLISLMLPQVQLPQDVFWQSPSDHNISQNSRASSPLAHSPERQSSLLSLACWRRAGSALTFAPDSLTAQAWPWGSGPPLTLQEPDSPRIVWFLLDYSSLK